MDDVKDSALRGQEYEDFFRSLPYEQGIEVSRIEKQTEFAEWCRTHGVENPNTIWSAKQDYERSLYAPLEPDGGNQAKKNPEEIGRHHTKKPHHFSWTDYMKRVEDESRAYAEEKAAEWNKSRDFSKARSFFDAYGQAQREFYNDYVKKNPKLAKSLAKSMGNGPMRDALGRIEIAEKNKRPIQANAPDQKKTAENKVKLIDKLAERKAKELSDPSQGNSINYWIAHDQAKRGLLLDFAKNDPQIFKTYVNGLEREKLEKDRVLKEVAQELEREELRNQSALQRNQRRQQELLKKRGPAPVSSSAPQKPLSRLSRLKNSFSNLRNGPAKFANSALSYFTRLLKRSIIGSVASALSAALSAMATTATILLSSLIAGAITAGVFAAAAISKIIVAITGTITTIVGALAGPQIIVVIVVALIIAIAAILFGPAAPGRAKQYSPYPGIVYSINSEYPKIANGQNIKYKIIVLYDPKEARPNLDELLLVDTLPPGTTLVPKGTTGIYDSTSSPGTIIWKLSKNTPTKNTDDGISYDFDLILDPQDDLTVENKITIKIGDLADNPGGGEGGDLTGLYEGADSRPTNNDCGKYGDKADGTDGIMTRIQKKWPGLGDKTNYGDPVCSYTDAKFEKVIELTETKHPENIPFWKDIAQSEGSSANSTDVPGNAEEKGTWGRFQMRRSFPLPGKTWDPEKNDRGDVPWQKQIENAISKNNSDTDRGYAFDYWGTAYCICWWPKYRAAPYCQDLIKNNRLRDPNTCQNNDTEAIGKRGPRQ